MTDRRPQRISEATPKPSRAGSPFKPPGVLRTPTDLTPKDKVLEAVGRIMLGKGKVPDPGKRPSQLGFNLNFWLQISHAIVNDLGLQAKVPDSKNKEYYSKLLSVYCDFLVDELK